MLTQALLVGLVAMFGKMDNQFGESFFQRPIVLCPLTGLVLGNLPMGLAVGGALEAMFLGSIGFGAYVPPDEIIGGVLACSFAITLGEGPETAIALAVPIASLAVSIKSGFYSIMSVFARLSERYAEKGSVRGVYATHFLIGGIPALCYGLICGLAFYFGADAVKAVIEAVPDFVFNGLTVAANILPALGLAMLGSLVLSRELVIWLFAGFLMSSYLGVPILGVALLAVVIGMVQFNVLGLAGTGQPEVAEGDDEDDF